MSDGHFGTGTLRTASGRQVRRPKESEVVDILSRYAHDSDDEDDSEDEDYTARSSYSTDRQYDSNKSGESEGEEDVIVQRKVSSVSRGGELAERGTGGGVESRRDKEQARKHSPTPSNPNSSSTPVGSSQAAQSLTQSPEMIAPLMMGFGQTRSGRTVVPSENFDILYLATKFGVNAYESDESNDEDFKAKNVDTTLESLSDASSEIGEADNGEVEKGGRSKATLSDKEDSVSLEEAGQEVMDTGAFVDASDEEDAAAEDKGVKMQACSVCLQESPAEDVVTCDRCGWMTHEDCYGIAPLEGEEETEGEEVPWFCDSCKMGVQPHCELCPNTGGLFKQVANGKWVHMVCCLYTPGVTFIEPSQLNCVVLDEILPLRWGQKACQLCSDPALAKTGVCVQCDVGMCRSAFHVTCAQKNGLLCETDMSEEELNKKDSVMDAYFAHCKVHSKKATVHKKARLWLSVVKQQQTFVFDSANTQTTTALKHMGDAYRKDRESLVSAFYQPAHVDLVQERFLHTCPEAVKLFARKAALMGLPPPRHPSEGTALTAKPTLSVQFVQHYRDSHCSIRGIVDSIPSLVRAAGEMDVAQRELLERRSAVELRRQQLEEEWGELLCESTNLYSQWGVPLPAHLGKRGRREEVNKDIECCVCYLATRQHLLIQCDGCKKHYHIGCLDPPLDAVPKKMKNYAWQCQECCCSEEEMLKPVVALEEERATKRGRKIVKPKYYGSP